MIQVFLKNVRRPLVTMRTRVWVHAWFQLCPHTIRVDLLLCCDLESLWHSIWSFVSRRAFIRPYRMTIVYREILAFGIWWVEGFGAVRGPLPSAFFEAMQWRVISICSSDLGSWVGAWDLGLVASVWYAVVRSVPHNVAAASVLNSLC